MGFIRQFFGYVWFISGGTITFLRLLQLLEVRPDEALKSLGGGFGASVLAVANVFGDVLNGIATWIAGQITGVEGYVESASSGILAGYNMAAMLNGKDMFEPDSKTCIGALPLYISNSANTKFQPMNANFGIIDGLNERIRNKAERYNKIANRALDIMKDKLKGENDDE